MILSVCPNPSIDTYAWLDSLNPRHANRISWLKEYPGGKATHIAMALRELNQPTALMGNWAGSSGMWIKRECNLKGIRTCGIEIQGQNRKCYTFRSNDPKFNNTELLEPGPEFTPEYWERFKQEYTHEISKHELICISGSWPKGAPENAYGELIEIANKLGRKVIVDCSGKQLEQCLQQSFFGLHLNEDEAISLFNTNAIETIISKLSPRVELIAITKGKEGLWLYYKGQLLHANVNIANVISTVGAGDCLTAGIAYAVHNNLSPDMIAKYGVACGAANCLNEDLGILKRKDVENLLPKTNVQPINVNDYAE
ncbi:1-phosphofructokinase family hexose kinase [Galbibacter pacificus]|uniref:PfkB family carbohydrate kinase n=1 Tax=Galbibacter pacificus TaxID=2996052 RepID=A0ABT6FUP7_9FLAO|nr:PfkB family carbohydrate kinase [Galbibacter pacificus]MDG3583564.1 PfkB family carbohydrate kinase [Galbibacter pacificus]MDG3586960.1 PfkB family carbohydrate kinase [Galbibacter pacificus]